MHNLLKSWYISTGQWIRKWPCEYALWTRWLGSLALRLLMIKVKFICQHKAMCIALPVDMCNLQAFSCVDLLKCKRQFPESKIFTYIHFTHNVYGVRERTGGFKNVHNHKWNEWQKTEIKYKIFSLTPHTCLSLNIRLNFKIVLSQRIVLTPCITIFCKLEIRLMQRCPRYLTIK